MINLPYKKDTKWPAKSKKNDTKRKKPEVLNNDEIKKHKSQGVITGME